MQGEPNVVSESRAGDANKLASWPPSIGRLVLAALVTSGLGFVVLKTLYPVFSVPQEIVNFPEQSPRWMYERLDKTKSQVDGKNFALVFSIIGAIFGSSCVVLAIGPKAIKPLVIAILFSSALGVGGALLSNWMFTNMRDTSGSDAVILGVALDGMKQSIVGYALLWSLIGLGVGLGIGSSRGFGKAIVAGISGFCGGALGSMIYVILTAQFSVGTLMNHVLPYNSAVQAIWLTVFTLSIAVCIALGTGERKPKPTT